MYIPLIQLIRVCIIIIVLYYQKYIYSGSFNGYAITPLVV